MLSLHFYNVEFLLILVESLFWGDNSPIQYAIEMSYKTTSEKVLKVLIDDSKLLVHLKAIKKYLLLGQGDFIQYFLELIQYVLFFKYSTICMCFIMPCTRLTF